MRKDSKISDICGFNYILRTDEQWKAASDIYVNNTNKIIIQQKQDSFLSVQFWPTSFVSKIKGRKPLRIWNVNKRIPRRDFQSKKEREARTNIRGRTFSIGLISTIHSGSFGKRSNFNLKGRILFFCFLQLFCKMAYHRCTQLGCGGRGYDIGSPSKKKLVYKNGTKPKIGDLPDNFVQ